MVLAYGGVAVSKLLRMPAELACLLAELWQVPAAAHDLHSGVIT